MDENPTGKADEAMLNKILRMKPKQIEQYVAAQRRKHGTDGGKK